MQAALCLSPTELLNSDSFSANYFVKKSLNFYLFIYSIVIIVIVNAKCRTSVLYLNVCIEEGVCDVCVCVRKREGERETESERGALTVYSVYVQYNIFFKWINFILLLRTKLSNKFWINHVQFVCVIISCNISALDKWLRFQWWKYHLVLINRMKKESPLWISIYHVAFSYGNQQRRPRSLRRTKFIAKNNNKMPRIIKETAEPKRSVAHIQNYRLVKLYLYSK